MRLCACGCGRSLQGRRANTRYALRDCAAAVREGRAPNAPLRRSGTATRRSGAQVSFRKAQRALVSRLGHFPDAPKLIEVALMEALPARQRERMR
jgi:hypothetical protein